MEDSSDISTDANRQGIAAYAAFATMTAKSAETLSVDSISVTYITVTTYFTSLLEVDTIAKLFIHPPTDSYFKFVE